MRFDYRVGSLLLATTSALSTQTTLAAESRAPGVEEVIVTAQRREERLQDVPIAITAITAADLQTAGATSTTDIELMTPGLIMPRSLRGLTPYLRGVGTTTIAPGIESPVATYVDGIYYMSANGNIFSFNNIDRVEVLKGPQGTLFGRNATGGLINVITRTPQQEPSVEGTVTYGKYETLESSLYATGGTERVAGNIAFHVKHQGEGYGDFLNFPGADANYEKSWGVMTKLLFTPGDDDRITLALDYTKDTSDLGVNPNLTAGMLHIQGITRRGGDFDSQNGVVSDVDSKYYGASVRWEHDFQTMTFSSITAYRNLDYGVLFDLDRTDSTTVGVDAFSPDDSVTLQQEFLLNGSLDRLNYTLGAFYFYADAKQDSLRVFAKPTAPTQNTYTYAAQKTNSYAVFAQGTYAVTPATHVTAGLRYTVDQRDFSGRISAAPGNPAPVGTVSFLTNQDDEWPKATWRLAVDQQLSEDIMAYVSYNRGFKSGSFNMGAITQPPVNPEVLDAYEVGVKSEWFDNVVRLNLAAFYYDYSDIQLSKVQQLTPTSQPVQVLMNAAKATIQGAELELEASPPVGFGELRLNATVSWIDGEYDSFANGPTDVPLPNTCAAPTGLTPTGGFRTCPTDLSGKNTVRTPDITYSVGASYNIPAGSGELGFNANYYYSDGFYWTADNGLTQPSYGILNGQIGYSFGGDLQHRVFIYGNNLTDDRYFLQRVRAATGETGAFGPPLTWGGGVSFKF